MTLVEESFPWTMDFSRAFTWILLDIYSIFTGFREIFYQWPAPSNSDLSRELIFNRLNNPVEKKTTTTTTQPCFTEKRNVHYQPVSYTKWKNSLFFFISKIWGKKQLER